MDSLYDKLIAYHGEDYYPMHMPGHKRNSSLCQMGNPYDIDITEIEGFDNLHQPEGILKDLSLRISRLYGAEKSYPLVNGSTAGILAGISAATNKGDKILIARNCHKAVYHAVILRQLVPIYCYPQTMENTALCGGILSSEIEEALITHKDIKLVVITSPTYEGVVSDIRAIADITHQHGAWLLVDEAHGAHFGFHEGIPQTAIKLGADLVIQSLHKTLPSFTQTAVLHSNAAKLNRKLEQYLAIYQSSSPSYLLMAGMDRCIRLLEEDAGSLFSTYHQRLVRFYQSMEELKVLKLMKRDIVGKYGIYDLDPSKLTITIKEPKMTGHQLHELLREQYQIVLEMDAVDYVLAMTSICDTKEGFERLAKALLEIDKNLSEGTCIRDRRTAELERAEEALLPKARKHPKVAMLPCEAWDKPSQQIDFMNSAGKVSADFVCLFPPGAPILVPGEVIEDRFISTISKVKQEGISITGLFGEDKDRIAVVCE